jgi:polyhydroxybutyrate depolymerase
VSADFGEVVSKENKVRKPSGIVALVVVIVAVLASVSLAMGAVPSARGARRKDPVQPQKSTLNRLSSGSHTLSISVGSLQRTFIVEVPSGKAVIDRALVLVYHGADDTAANTVQETNLLQEVTGRGDLIAFLQGYDNTWNEGSGSTPASLAHVNDVAFTSDVITRLRKLVSFDASRVAAVGFSNGAIMVEDLGCHLAARISLIVPVEGQLSTVQSASCAPAKAESVFEIHGTADTVIPYSGGYFSTSVGYDTMLSAPDSVARWASLDGCSATSETSAPSSSISLSTYSKCRDRSFVTLETVEGGGHSWPADIGQLVVQELAHLPK